MKAGECDAAHCAARFDSWSRGRLPGQGTGGQLSSDEQQVRWVGGQESGFVAHVGSMGENEGGK